MPSLHTQRLKSVLLLFPAAAARHLYFWYLNLIFEMFHCAYITIALRCLYEVQVGGAHAQHECMNQHTRESFSSTPHDEPPTLGKG